MEAELNTTKANRSQWRRLFTISANELQNLLNEKDVNNDKVEAIEVGYKKLERRAQAILELDDRVRNLIFSITDIETEQIATEYDECMRYQDRWIMLSSKMENRMAKKDSIKGKSEDNDSGSTSNDRFKKCLRRPKLELKKFSGELKEWIGFWAQFKGIHEDPELGEEDKFQYLIQCMKEGSKAKKFIDRFPPSAENYNSVIDRLKRKFGREDLLKEVYIRELLRLVLQEVSKEKVEDLSDLFDQLESQLKALEALGVTIAKYSFVLYPLVESALPEELFRVWERKRRAEEDDLNSEGKENPLGRLLKFLRDEVESEERLSLTRSNFTVRKDRVTKGSKELQRLSTAAALVSGTVSTCVFCKKTSHKSQDCFRASSFTLDEKREKLMRDKRCFQCLKQGHTARSCRTYVKCFVCQKKHLAVMCPEGKQKKEESEQNEPKEEDNNSRSESSTLLAQGESQSVTLLQTLVVKAKGPGGEFTLRALIDSGSQRSYIKRDCARKLKLHKTAKESFSHSLFGGVLTKQELHSVYELNVKNLMTDYSCDIQVLDQAKICNNVPKLREKVYSEVLRRKNVQLTDSNMTGHEVELLLGADVMGHILTGRVEQIEQGLIAVETKLGWTMMGKTNRESVGVLVSLLNEERLEDLWSLDIIGINDPIEVKAKRVEAEEAWQHFEHSVRRNTDGRYEVELPWILGHPPLETNRMVAEKRLLSTSKRLKATGNFEEYQRIFEQWQDLGIIEPCEDEENGHYLPHHAVVKPQSLTTKVRPVFDASAKDRRGNSLNACLFKGDNLVELIPAMILKFRQHEIGVCADIEKAFLQISVAEKHRLYFKFLWWENYEKGILKVYRHRRVVFGVTCSPFLLGAVIKKHLMEVPDKWQEMARNLQRSLYVDNLVMSVKNKKELDSLMKLSKEIMADANFNLRDWYYTNDEVGEEISVLGLLWQGKREDVIRCNIPKDMDVTVFTKRKLLAAAQRIFDPIGYTCPTTIVPKLLLQETWSLKLGWDDVLPADIIVRFKKWSEEVPHLKDCRLPRQLGLSGSYSNKDSFHVFSDASKIAFATCIFVRTEREGDCIVRLVAAKSRIAPLKTSTIPRLELMAALIATRLYRLVKEALDTEDVPVYFWTDSSVVLSWIRSAESWNVFVSNRIKEIHENSDRARWRHIPGEMNPADLPSRGCGPKKLMKSKWWEGPSWLRDPPDSWPKSEEIPVEEEVNRERKKTVAMMTVEIKDKFTDRLLYFSSYVKLIRMIGWMLRFAKNAKGGTVKVRGNLSFEEFNEAEVRLWKMVQEEGFDGTDSRIAKNLPRYYDERQVWRVKTRLALAEETEDYKCPIIVPSKHAITETLIRSVHLLRKHPGLNTLLALLRERFWVIKARKTVKRVVGKCLVCKRFSAKPVEVPHAPLPKERISCDGIFQTTGVDLAGPMYLKDGRKCWVVLFTCAVYRAIHLELTLSLSTEDYIAAFRRFVARRGRVVTIYSDNGTNFKGAYNLLKRIDWSKVNSFASTRQIEWKFNPPTAAWWGGWWERLVRIIKDLLRRNLGNSIVTYEELLTLICDCEALINSRPLTYLDDGFDSLQPLSPSCFLQGLPGNEVPDLDHIDATSLRKRLRYLQNLRECLRTRFRNEYTAMLISKGKRSPRKLNVGDVVLIERDNCKRVNWPLAVIEEIIKGNDGIPRVARLKTAVGEVVRPFQRLYVLEASQEELQDLRSITVRSRTRITKVPDRLDL